MSAAVALPVAETGTRSLLRLTLAGLALAVIGVLMLGVTLLLGSTTESGPFQHTADYVTAAAALPHGLGLLVATVGFHRLQRGRDGRLGQVGVWVYGVCMTELVIQCVASLATSTEVHWGPLYPVCALGLMVGLILLSAGSWKVGLLPRWMLGVWPPLGLVGSFLGIGPIPLLFGAFLVLVAATLPRRLPLAS